jgi:hypothetical protein
MIASGTPTKLRHAASPWAFALSHRVPATCQVSDRPGSGSGSALISRGTCCGDGGGSNSRPRLARRGRRLPASRRADSNSRRGGSETSSRRGSSLALGNRGSKIEEILNALDANSADYSLAVLTPVGTASLNKLDGEERATSPRRRRRPLPHWRADTVSRARRRRSAERALGRGPVGSAGVMRREGGRSRTRCTRTVRWRARVRVGGMPRDVARDARPGARDIAADPTRLAHESDAAISWRTSSTGSLRATTYVSARAVPITSTGLWARTAECVAQYRRPDRVRPC